MGINSSSDAGKRTAGRKRSRPIKVYLSDSDKARIVQFLQIRLDQCSNGIRKLCDGLSMSEITANRGQIGWFRNVESVLKYLLSTVNHPVDWKDPETGRSIRQ